MSYINQSVGFIDGSDNDLIRFCKNSEDLTGLIKIDIKEFIKRFKIN